MDSKIIFNNIMIQNKKTKQTPTIGFIILRHVNNEKTNRYWIESYDSIRKYYPTQLIMIIDDNSNYNFISNKELYKTKIIKSEYNGRGEILPYYYYLHNKLFDIAVIIHDSVFINSYIDFNVKKYKFIWEFKHNWDKTRSELKLIKKFNNKELVSFYNNKNQWRGCFGGMSIIKHNYLKRVNNMFNISMLLDSILTRYDRKCFERVISCLLRYFDKHNDPNKYIKNKKSLFGIIHKYGDGFKSVNFSNKDKYSYLPAIKIWTGR